MAQLLTLELPETLLLKWRGHRIPHEKSYGNSINVDEREENPTSSAPACGTNGATSVRLLFTLGL